MNLIPDWLFPYLEHDVMFANKPDMRISRSKNTTSKFLRETPIITHRLTGENIVISLMNYYLWLKLSFYMCINAILSDKIRLLNMPWLGKIAWLFCLRFTCSSKFLHMRFKFHNIGRCLCTRCIGNNSCLQ